VNALKAPPHQRLEQQRLLRLHQAHGLRQHLGVVAVGAGQDAAGRVVPVREHSHARASSHLQAALSRPKPRPVALRNKWARAHNNPPPVSHLMAE
jgi:hypothetical protein